MSEIFGLSWFSPRILTYYKNCTLDSNSRSDFLFFFFQTFRDWILFHWMFILLVTSCHACLICIALHSSTEYNASKCDWHVSDYHVSGSAQRDDDMVRQWITRSRCQRTAAEDDRIVYNTLAFIPIDKNRPLLRSRWSIKYIFFFLRLLFGTLIRGVSNDNPIILTVTSSNSGVLRADSIQNEPNDRHRAEKTGSGTFSGNLIV